MNITTYQVQPNITDRLKPLKEIANNIWWCWNPEATELFRRIDRKLWDQVNHNPIALLGSVGTERLKELEKVDSFLEHMDRVSEELSKYMNSASTWFKTDTKTKPLNKVAYFSLEFGLHESLPIYSGGLGILAGDHLKSASDIGLPLVGVGLMYHEGYFRQYLNADGWQQERYTEYDFYNMSMELMTDKKDQAHIIEITLAGRQVLAQIWKVKVGRVDLYLMDTNIKQNSDIDRKLTARLYSGDDDLRISQELLLGVGGVRVLEKLKITPQVYHMNEGHAAFLIMERLAKFIKEDAISLDEAAEIVRSSNVFTTHTPVPAGNDRFSRKNMEKYLAPYYSALNLNIDDFMRMGYEGEGTDHNMFCLTVFAINFAGYSNGVSALHGEVSRDMWKNIFPNTPVGEVPITSITNGIHPYSWISDEFEVLYNRYLGPRWKSEPVNTEIWDRVDLIPNSEMWRAKQRLKERLVNFSRERLRAQLIKRGSSSDEIAVAEEALDPDILTIGFARRFATYKRATLFMSDVARLKKILCNTEKPVQIIFAGKAHPKDEFGKQFIKSIIHLVRDPELRKRIVFIEDYDISVARYLVQGVDIWLNNPRRPLEASGTSGMKVPPNGGINFSVLDGWWCESYNGKNGWIIGNGETYENTEECDRIESLSFYDTLEKDIVPLYYNIGNDKISKSWLKVMKQSTKTVTSEFNTNRMVKEYTERFYINSAVNAKQLSKDKFDRLKTLAKWKNDIKENWDEIKIISVTHENADVYTSGDWMTVKAEIQLGKVMPTDISTEVYFGPLSSNEEISEAVSVNMKCEESSKSGVYNYTGMIPCGKSGKHGYSVRILPNHKDLHCNLEMRKVIWN